METLIDYLNDAFGGSTVQDGVLKYFYEQLYGKYNPDINGYTLVFMVPPDLSGYREKNGNQFYEQIGSSSYFGEVGQFMTFAAVDFTPPQSQVNSDSISSRTGAIPYATEVSESESCSVSFVDNSNLDIYMFHHTWIEYIREILEGIIEPSDDYILPGGVNYGAIDYAASIYIVKYRPDMHTITFVAKCMGVFPQSLPSKELIGTRTSNELTVLPFSYFCTAYREALAMETNNWILAEVEREASKFALGWQSVLGLSPGTFSQYFSSINKTITGITQMPNKIVAAGINKMSTIVGQTVGSVMGQNSSITNVAKASDYVVSGLGKITEKITSFPNKLFGS